MNQIHYWAWAFVDIHIYGFVGVNLLFGYSLWLNDIFLFSLCFCFSFSSLSPVEFIGLTMSCHIFYCRLSQNMYGNSMWCDAVRPVCHHDQKRIYGVARNEMAKILCEVDAYPAPTSFKWSFNNTAETIDMPQNGFEKHSRTSSRLSYTPVKVCYCL